MSGQRGNGNGFGEGYGDGWRGVENALTEETKRSRAFVSIADRVRGEVAQRIEIGKGALSFHVPFLDDCLRAIVPHDLVLVGAESGAGKTELAQIIAMGNARAGKRVHYIALEAEPIEIERRTKFKLLAEAAFKAGRPTLGLNYADWYLGRCQHIVGDLESEIEWDMSCTLGNLSTYYGGGAGIPFGPEQLKESVQKISEQTDLIVLDHLHYVDIEGEDENRGYKRVMVQMRDLALQIGKPVIMVVHLRKRDMRMRQLVPSLGDIHGSSDISKVCTRAVLLSPAWRIASKPRYAPTFFSIPKDRISGATGLVALCHFDRVLRLYEQEYTLGRSKSPGDVFEPLDLDDVPTWAKHHVPMHPGTQDETPAPSDEDVPQGDLQL